MFLLFAPEGYLSILVTGMAEKERKASMTRCPLVMKGRDLKLPAAQTAISVLSFTKEEQLK